MKKFQINEFITLKLENGRTVLYVDNEPFLQCKFLLIEIQRNEIQKFNKVNSVDEVAENVDIAEDIYSYNIPPETEFWGHCSNLQAWVEHDYDTRLIHSTLGFPLLEKLSEIGDTKAKNIFKEEIAKRLGEGNLNTVTFLYEEGYIEHLTREEFFHSLLVAEEAEDILELESRIGEELLQRWKVCEPGTFIVKNRHVKAINLSYCNLKEIPLPLFGLKFLEQLYLYNNKISLIPETIVQLRNLSIIDLRFNTITNTEVLSKMKNLKQINKIKKKNN